MIAALIRTIGFSLPIILSLSAQAQVLYTPGGTVQASTNGGVGFGTNTPRAQMEIFPICSSGGSTPSFLVSRPGNLLCVSPQSLGNYIETREYNSNNTSYTMPFVVTAGGRVGVNTSSPQTRLDVYTSLANDGIRITQNNAHGATLGLYNTTSGGRNWSIFSTGQGNSQGAGNFMIYDYTGSQNRFFIQGSTGFIGFGTANPTARLDINATGGFKGINITADRPDWSYGIHYQHQATNGLCKAIAVSKQGQDMFVVHSNGATVIGYVSDVAGLTDPGNSRYKLYVEKGILTEKVKVALQGTGEWSDFVFAPGYQRNSIDYIEHYIKQNRHLPNVPSASDVLQNGIDLGKMDATLLRQIEELWLFVIELKKENAELKNIINDKNEQK